MNLNRDQDDQDRENDRDLEREYNFKQSHGGRQRFPGGEWGESSEFGRNHESHFSLDKYKNGKSLGKESEFKEPMDSDFEGHEFDRSMFAEPYTGGQFSSSQWGRGGKFNRDIGDHNSPNYGGVGPMGFVGADERIRYSACELLYHNPKLDGRGIEVTVTEGVVTLKGAVFSKDDIHLVESCVEHLPGVIEVRNQLTVSGGQNDSRQ